MARRVVPNHELTHFQAPAPPPPAPDASDAAGEPRPTVPSSRGFPLQLAIVSAIAVGWLQLLVYVSIQTARELRINTGPQAIWMAPVSNLIWFGLAGLALTLLALRWPRFASPARVVAVYGFLAYFTLSLLNTKFHLYAMLLLTLGLAAQTGRVASRHAPAIERLARRGASVALAMLIAAALLANGALWARERWALATLGHPPAGAPNVLLLVLDTVRDFNVSLSGYERRTTPALERWAAQGTRYELAFSTAPWTLPSHAGIFTGRLPHELTTTLFKPLDGRHPTLAEAMGDAGYTTSGFAANLLYCTWQYGLTRGFVHFEDFVVTKRTLFTASEIGRVVYGDKRVRRLLGDYDLANRKPAAAVTDAFLRWLSAADGERPFFAFINYFDAHHPYLPPRPFDTLFAPRSAPVYHLAEYNYGDLTPRETAQMLARYDGGIAYQDREIDRLLRELERRGVLDNTVVIVTSDHGEHWGEHQRLSHGNSMYRQLLQVPLFIRYPRRWPAGRVVADPVSLRDIPATVLDAVGVANGGRFPGASLAAYVDDVPDAPRLVLASNASLSTGGAASLVAHGMHYIRKDHGGEELYDLARDPRDERDLAATAEGRAALPALRALMDSLHPRRGRRTN
jgi:arylsulfatase A-like enzyme